MQAPVDEFVLVLDFGGQYTQLIARRIRECRVYCEILPYHTPAEDIVSRRPKGIVFSGGPSSVYQEGAPQCAVSLYDAGIPILGICYGMQLMARQLGGTVSPAERREYGKTELEVLDGSGLFRGLEDRERCWMSHGDRVDAPPPGFAVTARTAHSPVAAMADPVRKLFGLQFHPEVRHTPRGVQILQRFLYEVCGCRGDWTMSSFLEDAVAQIRREVGDGRVLCALSGGVDSSVAAALVHRAVGDRLTCVFVDHGLLRQGESEQVRETFARRFGMRLVHVEAQDRFLDRLAGVEDPEAKRRIIGTEFIRVFEEEAAKLGPIDFLVQGTIYPDVVESGTATGAVIKTHHNVGGLPEDIRFKLIEPLRWLFKDEVRVLGEELGLPEEIVWRQPFPGPGLAVRVLGEVTREKLECLRAADAVVDEEIRRAGLYRQVWQSFAVLPPIRSVGVMGDERTYGYTIVIRAVESVDAMTADWVRLPYEVLETMSRRLVNEVKGINRVVYDITSKPPGTIEWE
ncbi:glutamine-hydrolyzing GMP synthase [Candidatus Desulforudis audaxviator]|uniref:GMP synthase [glutamine-hydrolyzing] n=1 Tax=Desulforudis audaxviator (strain MP104C) TaxID=477974 RepID=B1I585_DESAP|nr:glutamine-hydrolyzing GMP synthase [Candidatus Desulforudis audaxviator]ACA60137.1 GMP synthase, large subunit [Candidatus Desulforudis audaxviator MP104C]AZK60173.1 GMP synthase [glutamine-hydrolyzing], amidotransferase subunit [Candidatus Desulforudis audaxviator]